MFPSSSRVRLNRVALKDVVGLKLVPRRRRVPKSPNNDVTAESAKPEGEQRVCEVMSVKDTASVPGSSEPVHSLMTRQKGPQSVRDMVSNIPEGGGGGGGGEPEDKCVGTEEAKRRKCFQSRRENDSLEDKPRASCTRDIDRNTHPSPTGLAGSERSPRRAVGGSHCALSGDCKYTSILGKQGQQRSGTEPEQSPVELKIKKGNPVPETSKKIIIWIDQYPKVTLCDISQKCDVCCHNCGYVLPDVLKTKAVHCFKQDMRDGFRFGPGCLVHSSHESEESVEAKNSKLCPRVQSEQRFGQYQSLTKHQRHLEEHTHAEILSSHTTYHYLKGWTSEGSATCSASFLLDKRTNKRPCRTIMWDRDLVDDPGPGCDLARAEIREDKRIKLEGSVKDGGFPSTPDLESCCSDTEKAYFTGKEETCFRMSDDSHSELTFGICSSTVKENCVHKKPCGQTGESRQTGQMSSEGARNEVDADSFTCQRVRAYCGKIHFSCARTYMSWPFSNSSRTLTAHDAGTSACAAEPICPSPRNNSDSRTNQNPPSSPSGRTSDALPNAPADPSSDTTRQVSHQNEANQEEDGKRHGSMSAYSSRSETVEFAAHFMEAEESLPALLSDTATDAASSKRRREPGTGTVSGSSTPVNGPEADSSMSTPSPSALGLSDCEPATSVSPSSSLFTHGSLSSLSATPPSLLLEKIKGAELVESHSAGRSQTPSSPKCIIKAVEKPLFYCEETQMTSCSSSPISSNVPSHNSCHSRDSSLLLPQDEQESDEQFLADRSPPKLEPYYSTGPFDQTGPVAFEKGSSSYISEVMLLPLLSPVTSPQGPSHASFSPQSLYGSDEEEINKDTKHQVSPGHHMQRICHGRRQNCKGYFDHHHREGRGHEEPEGVLSKCQTPSFHRSVGDVNDGMEKESQDETDHEDDVQQGNRGSEQVPLAPKVKADISSGVLTEACSLPSSDEAQPRSSRDKESSPSVITGSEKDKSEAEAAGDAQADFLDEFTAYEQDILLVDVIQDDPELFENVPQKSLLKLGPTRVSEAPKTRPAGAVKILSPDGSSLKPEQGLTPVTLVFHRDNPDITEESTSRPWRPQCSNTPSRVQNNTWPATDKQTRNMGQSDANNNHVNGGTERSQPIQTVNSSHYNPPLMTIKNGPRITNPANMTDFRRQKSNSYCRQYFSESLSCGFKICRFQHVPVEGDEKFCIETVMRFIKNPMCLQKAGAVFTGYYQNSPPGVYFSMPVLSSLLWALLKAGMVSDVFSVLSVSLAHKIVPGHEFLLALFNFVRERGLMGFVPELMQLTFKMASAGLVLSLDWLDCVKNTPEFQQTPNPPASGNHKISASAPFPDYLNLAHTIVEIELCTKQEDWRRMGEVFRSICQSSQHPNQVEQISGRVAVALLSESKDKLSLPFAAFAETVCQNEGDDSLILSFLGRIGVSLMLRYHKTHQWAKGRRVVEVLSVSKVSYSTLKGLFGNEDGASRCHLVTVATELFLLSGSVEGALNTLRENKWFLSSCSWPCEPVDLDSRSRVLMRLAEKTSHRDTLEVLCNLPGIKEPNDLIDISRYGRLFNSHLQVCVDRQILPVASDTVDFMLSKNLAVDQAMLQMLLHKLGKQNLWLRAREVFRHSLSVGYYAGVSAPPGFMALIVPCRLGEVELALTFEMFITVNATAILQLSETSTSFLSVTLKRTQSGESEYLSAGSRLLSAACIPQPKLIVHYTAVNSSKEQVFMLDISSARRWLRHNHLWAHEVWTH